ncbi:MAG: hypothetical protein ACKVZJ_03755 [Phycisphaerales bacterium]
MTRSMLLVEIGPGRLQAGLWRSGALDQVHTVLLDESSWEQAWKEGLRPFDAALSEALSPLPIGGVEAVCFYHSPSVVVDVFSSPVAGRSGADAAMLALADAAGFSINDQPHDHCLIRSDPSSVHGGVEAQARQHHRLIAADSDEAAESVTGWLARAGVRATALVPMAAPHLRRLVDRVTHSEHEGATVMLRIGEHRAHLAASVGGRLRLVRHVSLDLGTLTQALTMPMTVRGPAGTSEVKLSREEARAVFFRVGVPTRDTVIDEARGLTGAAALPVVQPALQRGIVEMRQALRFGLEEPERAGARFVLVGPGASVPGLGEMLAAQLALTPALPTDFSEHQTDLHEAGTQLISVGINLLPRKAAFEQGLRRVKVALLAGAACALAYGFIDGALTWNQTRALLEKAEALREPSRLAREVVDSQAVLEARRASMSALRAAVRKSMGDSPPWSAWISELAQITPAGVTLRDISITTSDQGQARCELRGVMKGEPGARPDLGAFVTALEASPLVAGVILGGTQRSSSASAEQDAVDFQTTVTLVALPAWTPRGSVPSSASARAPQTSEVKP